MSHPVDHIRKYIRMTADVESALRQLTHKRAFRRGEAISSVGAMKSNAFFIQRGSARVFYLRDGKEYTFSFSFEDEFVAFPLFLLNDNTSDVLTYIQFLEPSQVYILPHFDTASASPDEKEVTEAIRENVAEILTLITTMMIEQTRQLEERVILLQNHTAVERYNWLLQRHPKIIERATITQIASYLGVTKETLYRIRGNKYLSNS